MASRNARLRKARRARTRAAQRLAQLEAGEVSLREILAELPQDMKPVRLWTLLLRTPHLGESGARKVCEKSMVWPTTRLGNLEEEALVAVLNHLPPRVK